MSATAPNAKVEIPLTELKDLCSKSLKTLGYQNDEVKVLLEVRACIHARKIVTQATDCGCMDDWTQVLMHAQLRDNNQGIVKITSGGLNK